MSHKLNAWQKHLLWLVEKGSEQEGSGGWAQVSKPVYPFVDALPKALVELKQTENGRGRARLTTEGRAVLAWL